MSTKLTYEELSNKLQEYEKIVQDISKLRNTEAALQQSEKKYRRLVESLERDYIIYSHDMDGNFTYISPSISNVLGYSQEEFLRHYTEYLTDSDVNKNVLEHTNAGLRGEIQEPYEAEFWHKDGHRILLRTTEVPVFDDNGDVQGLEGIVQDITELARAKAERESAIQKLKKALSEIQTLKGILPLCSYCKKVRDDKGYWEQVDIYISKHSEADVSHGICPECLKKEFPDDYKDIFPE